MQNAVFVRCAVCEDILIFVVDFLDAAGLAGRQRHGFPCDRPSGAAVCNHCLPVIRICLDEIEHICAAVCLEIAAVDINNAALIFAVIPCHAVTGAFRLGRYRDLDHGIADVRRGAVALIEAAVGDKCAVCTALDDRALDGLRDETLFVLAAHARDAVHKTECLIDHAAECILVGCLVDDLVLCLCKRGVLVVLCVLLVVLLVFLAVLRLFADGLLSGAFLRRHIALLGIQIDRLAAVLSVTRRHI